MYEADTNAVSYDAAVMNTDFLTYNAACHVALVNRETGNYFDHSNITLDSTEKCRDYNHGKYI